MAALRTNPDPWDVYVRVIGIRLQQARVAANMSQERIAHAAGISTYTYSKLERGESNPGTPANPRLRTLVALAEVLDLKLTDLVINSEPLKATQRR